MANTLRTLLMLAVLAGAPLTSARAEGTPGVFDFYVLSLSWSPSYCLSKPQDVQCQGKGYGFVLHGLWPQYANNRWPQFCEPFTPLSDAERAKGMTLFPSPALMAHEWKKHGTCSGLGAVGYLNASDTALATVAIPAQLEASANAQRLGARQIKALFRERNPAIPEDGLAVYCARGQLSEVRVCLSKSLQPMACGAALKGQCKQNDLLIPGVR